MTMTMLCYGCGTVEQNYIARDRSNLVILCSFIFMDVVLRGGVFAWGGGSIKFYTGKLRPEFQTLTLIYIIFLPKR